MQISGRTISLIEVSSRGTETEARAGEGEGNSENGRRARLRGARRDAASLIIGLNVANADFDESSGFECPLQYVTVTPASQLTN